MLQCIYRKQEEHFTFCGCKFADLALGTTFVILLNRL